MDHAAFDRLEAYMHTQMQDSAHDREHVYRVLYTCTPEGEVCDGSGDAPPSFFQEYRFKLEKVYDRFFTAYAAGVAAGRRRAAQDFYASLLSEARAAYGPGRKILRAHLT